MCRMALTVKTLYEPSCKVYGRSSWLFLVGYGHGLKGVRVREREREGERERDRRGEGGDICHFCQRLPGCSTCCEL